jgi:superfamily I DNA and/or RNA helicase
MVPMSSGKSKAVCLLRMSLHDSQSSFVLFSPTYGGPAKLLGGQPYSFLQVNGNERQAHTGSYENQSEASVVVQLVQQLQRAAHRVPGKWHSADRIRIITFYQAQVSLIKRLLFQRRLRDVVVATVDSSQGCEADIVIVSFVRSHGSAGKTSVGFLSDNRRMNVAITRGKINICSSLCS